MRARQTFGPSITFVRCSVHLSHKSGVRVGLTNALPMNNTGALTRRTVTLGVVILYLVLDLFEAFTKSETYASTTLVSLHHWVQVVMVALVLWTFWSEFSALKQARSALDEAEARLARLSADLADYISGRFRNWGLTGAETETAWLLLKGFSIEFYRMEG